MDHLQGPGVDVALELYVYYKVSREQQQAAMPAVNQLLSRCRALGVTARLLRRRDVTADGVETWMEVYGQLPDDFDSTLAQLVEATGCAALTGERIVEWFVAC